MIRQESNGNKPTITQHFTRAVIRAMEVQGIAIPNAVLERVSHYQGEDRIPMAVQDEIWTSLVAENTKPGFGLEIGLTIQPGSLDLIGFLLLSCDTLEDALDALITYNPLVSEGGEFLSTETPKGVQLIYSPFYKAVREERVETVLSALVTLSRYLTGGHAHPIAVNVAHPVIGDALRYQQLGCPVYFDQAVDSIVFSREHLETPLMQANTLVNQQMRQLADDKLKQFKLDEVSKKVSMILNKHPDWSKDQVADAMHVSGRHLNRLLSHEGCTYRSVADDVRSIIAKSMFLTDSPLYAIAITLGFSDESAFSKAFKRWTGLSPTQFKAQQQ
ncbi:MAG: AraC-like DNA-binding protein [Reinekea sp.]|jgi:AraC-like DNA-binding protein|uniref:AraC family transcriptional regulator n=2 Tax=Reinekea sp. TaxID=1970455 RepID=UPI003988BC2A